MDRNSKRPDFPGYFFLVLALLTPLPGRAVMTFQPNDGNVRLDNDIHRSTDVVYGFMSLATGDFDGDGLDDVALCMKPYAGNRTIEVFLAPFEADAVFSAKKSLSIRYAISEGMFDVKGAPSLALADLNHDGKADLIIGRQDHDSGLAQVDMVMGRENPSGEIDLDQNVPNGRIYGVSQVAVGDFDGDGTPDLAMCKPLSATCYLALGGPGLFSGIIDIAGDNPFHRISLGGALNYILAGDFDGDHKTDFAFTPQGASSFKEVAIVFGKEDLPVSPSPSGIPVDVRVRGTSFLRGMAVGDVTGDGRSELFLQQQQGANNGTLWAVDGVDVSGGDALLTQGNNVTFYSVGLGSLNTSVSMVSRDFDGDGANDLFFNSQDYKTHGYLSSEGTPGGITLSDVGSPALEWSKDFGERMGMGDLNGDGYNDLIVYEDFGSIYPPHGALRVFYGFRPLTHPQVGFLARPGTGPRVTLALAVDGDPKEMFLSGNITNDFKEKWIDFRTELDVLLSPEEGTQRVNVVFRNAVGRVSDLAQASTEIHVGPSSVVTGTNRLRSGGTVVFDCHVVTPGPLRAKVFGPGGAEVRVLEDRSVDPGVYSLFWNGENASGHRVGRGVYALVIETNGGRTKKDILVE
jgi:hypothetical protein